jgi:23S rRNA (adenine2503-C2)-methyltransferase
MSSKKIDIRSLKKNELIKFLNDFNYEPYRAQQILSRLNSQQIDSFEKITNIPKDLIQLLDENFFLSNTLIHQFQKSSDLTFKFSIKLHDNLIIEAVLIPTEKRITACVSSQVGCSLDCNFCATSRLKRIRNLESYEIYDQIMLLNNESLKSFSKPISNIVFMGMGEPLLNYNNVIHSIDLITGNQGLGISKKKITLSTSGIFKMIKKMADDNVKFNLAISLHSAIEETRNQIMPFSKSFPLKKLIDSLEYWYLKTKIKITFEYLVWKDINDDFEHINALVKICKRIPSKVNLIEYNSINDERFISADQTWIDNYVNSLRENNIQVSVRRSRGKDIDAACGQLANKH